MNPKEGGRFADYNQKFETREHIEGLSANILDIVPHNPQGAIYFSPGWNSTINDYKNPISQLYFANERVISAELPTQTEEEKADAIVEIIERKGLAGVDFMAHSVGSMSTVLAAEKLGDRVSKVILVNPSSMIGEDSEKELIGRYRSIIKNDGEETNENNGSTRREVFDMASTIVNFDMFSHILELKKSGVKIVTVHSVNDALFPAGRVCDASRRRGWGNFVIVPGGHMSMSEHMEGALDFLRK